MLTRRGFAACAICAVAGFLATGVEAQTPGFRRTILKRIDGPVPGYETIEVRLDIDPGTPVARHTHPGVESAYVIEGATEVDIEGVGPKTYNAGDGWQVPTGVVHGGRNLDKPTVVATTYIVEKGKPLASPA